MFRGRTWKSISMHARQMGLRGGIPQGYISLSKAEVKFGFDRDLLLRICGWAGLLIRNRYPRAEYGTPRDMHKGMCGPKGVRRRSRKQHVDEGDLREAVERWMAMDNIQNAARRHGLSSQVMTRILRKAGMLTVNFGRKSGYRIDPKAVDALMYRRRHGETVTTAARRIGVYKTVVFASLRAAKVKIGHDHSCRLLPGEAERAVARRLAMWCSVELLDQIRQTIERKPIAA